MSRLRQSDERHEIYLKIESVSDIWLGTASDEKEKWEWHTKKDCRHGTDDGRLNRRAITFIQAIYNDKPLQRHTRFPKVE